MTGLCITDKQNEREHIFIDCQKMPMPMGAHAAQKVHANMLKAAVEKEDHKKDPKDPGMLFQSKGKQ